MAGFVGDLRRQSLELLLPSTCRLCDRCIPVSADFCPECLADLTASEPLMRSACRRCGRPGAAAILADHAATTRECRRCKNEKFEFDGCVTMWTYDGRVRNAVVAAKYGSQIALAHSLGLRLAECLRDALLSNPDEAIDAPDLVTCVPSHLWRRIQRGNGGSRVLAQSVARELRRTLPTLRFRELLRTTRKIKKQAMLREKERSENVRGAFRVRKSGIIDLSRTVLRGGHVLLIDDVMTTGATASENARVLKRAGARRVTVGVIARAVSH